MLGPMVGGPLVADPAAAQRAGRDFLSGISGPATGDAVTAESANEHAAAAQPTSIFGRIGQGLGGA